MKHWIMTLCCFGSLGYALSAQQLAPAVLASNGGTGMAAGLQLDWTLGELAVEGLSGQKRNFTEGFHQPIIVLRQIDITAPEFNRWEKKEGITGITVSPNPVSTDLMIHFDKAAPGTITCQVLDANGNTHLRQSFQTAHGDAHLDLSGLAPGLFFIRFMDAEDGTTTVFKLAKIQ
jgi:hypothetical protein